MTIFAPRVAALLFLSEPLIKSAVSFQMPGSTKLRHLSTLQVSENFLSFENASKGVPVVAPHAEGPIEGELVPERERSPYSGRPDGTFDADTLTTLPRHSNPRVTDILVKTEELLQNFQKAAQKMNLEEVEAEQESEEREESIFANNYVDLGKIDTIGFDYDYTLVTYTDDLLELIYEKALARLVSDRQYPSEMLDAGLQYDPFFSIRGLAVDKETGWITHLSYTHKVAVAWEGREKLPTSRLLQEYRMKRALDPAGRKKRLKPLNDLFSMSECCLIADTIQFFKDRNIAYSPKNVVNDVLKAVTETHLSGEFHRLVAAHPERYFRPTPHLSQVLSNFKAAGKRLIFVSNSPFWYVDAGMRYIFGHDWRKEWDAIITSKSSQTKGFCVNVEIVELISAFPLRRW